MDGRPDLHLALGPIHRSCDRAPSFGGLKLAVTFAVIGAVIGEFVAGNKCLGYLIQSASGAQRMDILFAGVIIIFLMSLVVYCVVQLAERRFVFWHPSQQVVTA